MKIRKLPLTLALLIFIAFKSYALPPLPQPQSIPPPVGDPVPIDSEISILFVGGVLLGLYYFLKKPKTVS